MLRSLTRRSMLRIRTITAGKHQGKCECDEGRAGRGHERGGRLVDRLDVVVSDGSAPRIAAP
eukprot:scaffold93754_cov48-Phaeocystis_antarctica.AAC.1